MTRSWPPSHLHEFVQALPFEHLLRKRAPQEALARWAIESQAFTHAGPCRIGLLLSADGDPEEFLQTVACWRLQTWPDTALIIVRNSDSAAAQALEGAFPPKSTSEIDCADPSTLQALGVDWVIPAVAGDLLHPSLAGTIAQHATAGAAVVAWDWVASNRNGRNVNLLARCRGPWRDELAEMCEDLRHRAFALPAKAWSGHPAKDAFKARMTIHGDAESVYVHPEPLGIYRQGDSTCAPDPMLAAKHWGVAFLHSPHGMLPAKTSPGISVLILYRDRLDLTLKAIDSVLAQRFDGRIEIVLVDNQSTPATKTAISKRILSLPDRTSAKLISYDEPFNHSRQCNLAAQAASEEVLVFLNNDVVLLDSHALDLMSRWALVPGIASVGVRMVGADSRSTGGGFQARRLPGAEFNSPIEEATGVAAERSRITVGNTFACAAITAEAFSECGGLDEVAFPVGYNDVDFCLRATRRNRRHLNLANVRASHAVGASRARVDEISQKLTLRIRHAWLGVHALQEIDQEPIVLPEVVLPSLSHDIVTAHAGASS